MLCYAKLAIPLLSLYRGEFGQVDFEELKTRAQALRNAIKIEIAGMPGAHMFGGTFKEITVWPEGKGHVVTFTDDSGVAFSRTGKVVGFGRRDNEARDRLWNAQELISLSQAQGKARRFFAMAGYSDQVRFEGIQTWGGVGADVPQGDRNRYMLSARRSRNGVMFGRDMPLVFEIDARTGEPINVVIGQEPALPPSLTPGISFEDALARVMAAYFAADPECELSIVSPSELCISDLKVFKDNPRVPAYARQAAAENRGLLTYEISLVDLSIGGLNGPHPLTWAILDARTGAFIYRQPFYGGVGLGSGAKASKTPVSWDWGSGPITVMTTTKRIQVPEADIAEAKSPFEANAGCPIMLKRGKLTVLAVFHEKAGLVSRQIGGKRRYGKPNPALLKALKKFKP